MCKCFCLSFLFGSNSSFEQNPFAKQEVKGIVSPRKNEWDSSQQHGSINSIRFPVKNKEEIAKVHQNKKNQLANRDITKLSLEEANFFARFQPAIILVRLDEIYKKGKNKTADEKFLEKVLPKSARKIIFHGIQKELDEKEPSAFLQDNSSLTRLITIYIAKGQGDESKKLILNFIQNIPGIVNDDEKFVMSLERIDKIKETVAQSLNILSFLIDGLNPETKKLLFKIRKMIDKKGESNPAYHNKGVAISFGQYTIRYFSQIISCLELSGMNQKDPGYGHKLKTATILSTIIQYLNMNLNREELETNILKQKNRFLIDLILEFQEKYNKIRNSLFRIN